MTYLLLLEYRSRSSGKDRPRPTGSPPWCPRNCTGVHVKQREYVITPCRLLYEVLSRKMVGDFAAKILQQAMCMRSNVAPILLIGNFYSYDEKPCNCTIVRLEQKTCYQTLSNPKVAGPCLVPRPPQQPWGHGT